MVAPPGPAPRATKTALALGTACVMLLVGGLPLSYAAHQLGGGLGQFPLMAPFAVCSAPTARFWQAPSTKAIDATLPSRLGTGSPVGIFRRSGGVSSSTASYGGPPRRVCADCSGSRAWSRAVSPVLVSSRSWARTLCSARIVVEAAVPQEFR